MKIAPTAAIFAAALISSATAFADSTAVYTGSETNEAEVTTADYSTILISKVDDDADPSDPVDASNVVYVNQAERTFEGTLDFLITADPLYGKYKVQFGSPQGDKETTYFYIGIDPTDPDTAMTRVGEEEIAEGYWNVGYTFEIDLSEYDYNSINSVKVSFDSVAIANSNNPDIITGGYSKEAQTEAKNWPAALSGSGIAKFAFQINRVPEMYKDSITVYFSEDELSDAWLLR